MIFSSFQPNINYRYSVNLINACLILKFRTIFLYLFFYFKFYNQNQNLTFNLINCLVICNIKSYISISIALFMMVTSFLHSIGQLLKYIFPSCIFDFVFFMIFIIDNMKFVITLLKNNHPNRSHIPYFLLILAGFIHLFHTSLRIFKFIDLVFLFF